MRHHLPIALALAAIVGVALLMLRASWDAPLQRDASHFVFMAAHIAKGHAPYWALWETKNPLVELWWAGWIGPLEGLLSWVHAARLAECVWMGATALVLAAWVRVLLRGHGASAWGEALVAGLAGAAWLAWVSSSRINDDGLTISMYHALPELGVMGCCARLAHHAPSASRQRLLALGALLGLCVFACWFVKQTSVLVALGLVVATLLLGVRPSRGLAWALAAGGGVALLCLLLFAWHLHATGTWQVYLDGAITYKSRMAVGYPMETFGRDMRAHLDLGRWIGAPLATITTTTMLACVVGIPCVALALWRRVHDKQPVAPAQLNAALTALWLLIVVAQAVASLTFFRHYFLAGLAPLVACVAAWLAACRWSRGMAAALIAGVLVALLWPALMDPDRARRRSEEAPLTQTMRLLHALIPREARVLNWSGLLHYFVLDERTSAYPRNVWWPAIVEGVDERQRTAMMREMLTPAPPEFVLELFEEYPRGWALHPQRLTPAMLEAWTGGRYELVLETPPQQGRYAMPARLFRLVPTSHAAPAPPTIPSPSTP